MTIADVSLTREEPARREARGRPRGDNRRPIVVRHANPGIRAFFALLAPALDICAILIAASAAGSVYHHLYYGSPAVAETQLRMGALIALLLIVPNILRAEYELPNYLTTDGHLLRVFKQWNIAFLFGMSFVFFSKTGDVFSRGSFIFFYLSGFLMLAGARVLSVALVRQLSRNGPMLARRVFVVGADTEVLSFVSRHWPLSQSVQIVGLANISPQAIAGGDGQTLERELQGAVARARLSDPDDVFVLIDRDHSTAIDCAIDRFLTIPASIHLGSERMLERFTDAKVSKIGEISLLSLTRRPLSGPEIALKRMFDIVASGLAIVFLAPFALVVAALIRLDSAGPVFFLQQRYGFNQKPFRIIKFRTMTAMDDGATVRQAQVDDPRITRVGHFLRRWNIDELPQILNVLRGEMSLVGPRPHALAHDHHFMQRIALYARRHNVKPGITGWAQVNGFRGETDTDDKMRGRVEHDLHYIDNWSMTLDLKIILLTLFSSRAYANAR